ncbi:TetR/AcrR family transcriptional regulator [Sporosarcina sp. BI001-red]|uniref:TetR/AcrR family transcriptional regulator n=1 Tax=Sporosarcina sp. BI001-red TaxID=2282866 RepID=UPI000E2208DE|nr:TetR/AcrR family transcriptional regulator [Sporosarcina sp. BI001-red]REB08001.1 TetR/AcrR family transcriptional regulator [Sporosarcina sp. BI001-red]
MSPRNKEQFKEIRDQRQQELRRSAVQMFSQKGFAAAKISDITSNAKLSHGLFYHYFASKEELYIEVIRDILYDFVELVEQATEFEMTALSKMEWLTDATHSGSIREGVYRHILVLQALYSDHLNELAKQEIVALYKEAVDGIGSIIKTGQEEGDFIEGDPEELATYHLSLAHGLLLWNARTENPVELSTDKVLRQLKKIENRGAC